MTTFKKMRREHVEYIAVHCSATPPDMNIGAHEIDLWHRRRGWLKIGYHFVIRRDGTVETGRPTDQPGAHVRGYNQKSIGICLVGGVAKAGSNVPKNNFTPEQFAALHKLRAELLIEFPWARFQGHRDFPGVAKACPSFDATAPHEEWPKTK